mmetsp:Transcript_36456/g.117879  ORF Transcript_36456/g.117879 Transcript_36456/m.117879 type:complete len:351 (-) Transcript_36456:186-1238(-)
MAGPAGCDTGCGRARWARSSPGRPRRASAHQRSPWCEASLSAQARQEPRVREATKRGRERFRARQRGFDYGGGSGDGDAEPVAVPTAPVAPVAPAAPKLAVAADSAEAKEGAQSIADRLKCIKDRSDAAEKRSALAKVVTGGRDNYYTFDPSDVVADLKERGLLDTAVAAELQAIISDAAPTKKRLPPSEWLVHAQKLSSVERVDDKPFKESENLYLKSVEEKSLVAAEKELAAAEAQLKELLSKADALNLPEYEDEQAAGGLERQASATEPEVDEDHAARVEAHHDAQKESRGGKNTSSMTDKEISCKKWDDAHGKEARDREHDKKAREARREEARDMKSDAANVPDDA